MIKISQILVPSDFSPESDRALDYALDLAAKFGASVHIVHAVEDPFLAGGWAESYAITLPDIHTNMREDAERQLAVEMAKAGRVRVPVTGHAPPGSAAQVIVESAKQLAADLIVMGTHGRGGFIHLMLGSVAERVVRTAPCPVLTVRAMTEPVAVDEHPAAIPLAPLPV